MCKFTIEKTRMMVETSDKVLSSLAGNLMRNAVAYTGVGDVHVREYNAIHIEDSGPAWIATTSIAFAAFYRGRNTGRQSRSGYGVGPPSWSSLASFAWPVEMSTSGGRDGSISQCAADRATYEARMAANRLWPGHITKPVTACAAR